MEIKPFLGRMSWRILCVLLAVLVYGSDLYGQSTVIHIDTIDYSRSPRLSVRCYQVISRLSLEELRQNTFVIDRGQEKPFTLTYDGKEASEPLSLIVVIDELAVESPVVGNIMRELVFTMGENTYEAALVSTSDDGPYQPFTTSDSELLYTLDTGSPGRGGSLANAFTGPNGVGQLLSTASHRPVVILFSYKDEDLEDGHAANICRKYGCPVYVLQFEHPIRSALQDLAEITGGSSHDRLLQDTVPQSYVNMIVSQECGLGPYTVSWMSEIPCVSWVNASVSMYKAERLFHVAAADVGPELPTEVRFTRTPGRSRYDTTIVIKALHRDIVVNGVTSSDPSISVSPRDFIVNAGDSLAVTVSYDGRGTGNIYAVITFGTDACALPLTVYVEGEAMVEPVMSSIRAVFPSNGDFLLQNKDTTITWTGGADRDTVDIEYSIDGGRSWRRVGTSIAQRSYRWRVPNLESGDCILRFSPRTFKPDTGWSHAEIGAMPAYVCVGNDGSIVSTGSGYVQLPDGQNPEVWGDFVTRIHSDGSLHWRRNAITDRGQPGEFGPAALMLDSVGNIYSSGSYLDKYTMDAQVLRSQGKIDAYMISYDSSGQARWGMSYGGVGVDAFMSGRQRHTPGNIVGLMKYDAPSRVPPYKLPFDNGSAYACIMSNGSTYMAIDAPGVSFGAWVGDVLGNIYTIASVDSLPARFGDHHYSTPRTQALTRISPDGAVVWGKLSADLAKVRILDATSTGVYVFGRTHQTQVFGMSMPHSYEAMYYIVKLDPDGNVVWAHYGPDASIPSGWEMNAVRGMERPDGTFFVILGMSEGNALNGRTFTTNANVFATFSTRGILMDARVMERGTYESIADAAYDEWSSYIVSGLAQSGSILFGHTMPTTTLDHMLSGFVIRVPESELAYSYTKGSFGIGTIKISIPDVDMGVVPVGSTKDSIVSGYIRNISPDTIVITSITIHGSDSAHFDVDVSDLPISIAPGASYDCSFTFTPDEEGIYPARVCIGQQGRQTCGAIVGMGVINDTMRVRVVVDDIAGKAGETVPVVLRVTNVVREKPLSAPLAWRASLSWNSSILYPESGNCTTTSAECEEHIEGTWDGQPGVLATIPATITLGQTDRGTIALDSFEFTETQRHVRIVRVDGSITVTDVCEDGSVRLYLGTNVHSSLAVRPNPATSAIRVHYGVREALDVSLELVDGMGAPARQLLESTPHTRGEYMLDHDLADVPAGLYFLRLTTPKGILTTRLAIVR